MQLLIKLELEDIITRPFGDNLAITPENGPIEAIILSPRAAQELVADLQQLLDKRGGKRGKSEQTPNRGA